MRSTCSGNMCLQVKLPFSENTASIFVMGRREGPYLWDMDGNKRYSKDMVAPEKETGWSLKL